MKNHISICAATVILCSSYALAANYTAIDLTTGGWYTISQANKANGAQQVGYGKASWGLTHAFLWNSSSADYVDLNPAGCDNSAAIGIFGSQQVGWGSFPSGGSQGPPHALLWNGTAASYVDINPAGFTSTACGTNGAQQVGYGKSSTTSWRNHALLWNGSAANYVDLHPTGYNESFANAVSGTYQVGYGSTSASASHALLWNSSASSSTDLNPDGFVMTCAYDISGAQQVGYGLTSLTAPQHALLWLGTANSFIDLNPAGFTQSTAFGTNGTQQVGKGYGSATNNGTHAILWNGSTSDYVDLHQYLPAGFGLSRANGIDIYGNIVGYATDASGNDHAFLWQPVPEPCTLLLLGLGAAFVSRKRR
jgi:probable HAF family extracellular repeat protein